MIILFQELLGSKLKSSFAFSVNLADIKTQPHFSSRLPYGSLYINMDVNVDVVSGTTLVSNVQV